jgi:DNA modification methylase
MFEINKTYNENCIETMKKMPDDFIDLTVTSPPYDNLRNYKGYHFDFKGIANQLYKVTKKGGVVVWIVGDATIKGNETGTSFAQALYFKKVGFLLHDTMIYEKTTGPFPSKNRYTQLFEYMFVFSKDRKPNTFNAIRIPTVTGGKKRKKIYQWKANGEYEIKEKETVANHTKIKGNIWKYHVGGSGSKNYGHPAVFPRQLGEDHILSWSNEGDLVYDPFMGSGTTAELALVNKRNYIGSEISEEYCNMIKERLEIFNK